MPIRRSDPPRAAPTTPHPSPAGATRAQGSDELAFARAVLRHEADAIAAVAANLDEQFGEAVSLLEACAEAGGSVLVTGMGKSGLIGAKIAATLSSLGIAAHAVHPAEAAHGDLGRFRPSDTVICLSRSGETDEVVNLAAIVRQDGLPIISITGGTSRPGRARSSLERLATVALLLGDFAEAGDGQAAPTASTTATVALGDALALAAARRRNFDDADFARRHPGGTLGGLLRPVVDVMRVRIGAHTPAVPETTPVIEALRVGGGDGRRVGATLLVDASGRLSGIFTDADVRRRIAIAGPGDWLQRPIAEVMTRTPTVLGADALVRDAVRLMRERRLDELPIVDHAGRPVGLLDVQDLVALRLVKDDS
ncbi:MAG TPA: KpsF/GutQ family sugar-phosphate isomerase [Phycisphaerales bacterium]|nr:KpsF/GutQ family sugar-phosphate isomerase [Phycisphaerales bacterium]